LYTLFASTHRSCLERVAGGGFTHVATVPSTRERPGIHPLRQIITVAHRALPFVLGTANHAYGNSREFQPDRFRFPAFGGEGAPPRVLLLEDLWVTGARAHSMAHALKLAGAATVVTVASGRQMNHIFPPNRAILDKARHKPFDLDRCPPDDFST
jgi:hypothetical protein